MLKRAILLTAGLLLAGNVWSTPDPVYEYESVLRAYLIVQRCSLVSERVSAGFIDASIHFTAGAYVSSDAVAALRASLGSQVRREWNTMSPEQRQYACKTQGRRYADRLRSLLFENAQ
jgi:hypothetical protein